MKIKILLLFLFAYQFVLGQNCEVYMQKFQNEYQRQSEASWKKINYGGAFDKTKFNEAKIHITRFINCKADEIGYENEVLTKLKNAIDLIYREDTNLIIAGVYDEKKSLNQSKYPNRYYIINSKLEIVNEYDRIHNYSYSEDNYNKEIYLVFRNNKYGIIDKHGKELVQPKYDHIFEYAHDRTVVMNNEKRGVIDKMGNEIVYPKYDGSGNSFSDGYLTVCNGKFPNDYCGLIDKEGKETISLQYKGAGRFFGSLFPVYKDKKWGFINIKNEIIIPFKFDALGDDSEYGEAGYNSKGIWYYRVQRKWGGKMEFINKKGETFKNREDVRD